MGVPAPLPRAAAACLWLLLLASSGSAQSTTSADGPKPQITSMLPANMSVGVSPAVNSSVVKFDRDMSTLGASLVFAGRTLPNTTAEASWSDPRTLVLPLHLQENRTYAIGLNGACRECKGVRAAEGAPLQPAVWTFSTWAAGEPAVSPGNQRDSAIEVLRLVLAEYAYRDRLGVDWEARWRAHRFQMEGAGTGVAFAEAAAGFLGAGRDGHVFLDVSGDVVASHVPVVDRNVNASLLRGIVADWREPNRHVATGRLGTSVRYVAVRSWAGGEEDYYPVSEALMSSWRWRGVIFDVRESAGGNVSRALEVAGHFVDRRVPYASHRRVDASAEGGFGPTEQLWMEPREEHAKYDAGVVVLMGPANVGAAESFILMMGAGGATLVGQTSYGSLGNPVPHALPNGVVLHLPSRQELLPNGEVLEGRGVDPDVAVEWDPSGADDPVLRAAVERLT
ncbi:unnamed protein product [Ostreobium quekettii]|uniref:Tail specific protease domain-containing protein n=1 Tax=Ostreobium quekettii TaxID=121088 RepID=A0A8S1JBC3_9CHLO|nr:unnamed protein product [Ostreobium quekettii]|eukprot:evm.model.scf_454.6 EVM.evm.TU.scf_454.6   scf_454:52202-53554(-)